MRCIARSLPSSSKEPRRSGAWLMHRPSGSRPARPGYAWPRCPGIVVEAVVNRGWRLEGRVATRPQNRGEA
ncbi:MAG: hypothetical protein AVDCRST_MAG73-14 [uncultured Thermomicrobiales bacterium]|uniref:Uncharacterized protein n=1 Tax=uncultured Thermomicrobiales bacterium TaxID=1645740 RepID=A0A6J4TBD9_9BACT|nr:MAG: hypothetical protein AVDCRST_MAG73-14 [uncultured Thermomicrobiales bacterium]